MPTNVFCNQLIYIPLTPLSACSSFPAASMLRYPMKHLFTPHFHPTNPGYPSQSHLLIQALFSGEGLCLSWLHPYVSTPHPCPLLILPLILSSSSPHPLLIPSSYSPRPLLIHSSSSLWYTEDDNIYMDVCMHVRSCVCVCMFEWVRDKD